MDAKPDDPAGLDTTLLRAMAENAVDGIIAIDQRGLMKMVNPGAEHLFRYTAQEMLGCNVSMLMPEPYHSEHDQYLRRYLETGQRRIIGIGREVEGRRKDGTTFPMYLSVAEARHGDEILFTGIVHDLTEIKRAEQRIRWLQRQQRLILDAVGDGILGVDADGRIIFANPAAQVLLGSEQGDLVGQSLESIWRSSDATEPFPGHAIAAGEPYRADEAWFARRGGGSIPVALVSTPMCDGDRPVGAVLSFQDITERKRASQEMQRIRSYLKNIIDSMPSILVGVDDQGRITEWNTEAEHATGVLADRALGRGFVELLPQLGSRLDKVHEALRLRQFARIERLASEDGGEVRYFDVVVYPLIGEGMAGAVIRVDDVTNRVRIEQMMVQTEKMMSVGGLAAGMAHEINNPLSGILQSCQNIQRRLALDLPANRAAAQNLGLELEQVRRYLERREILVFLEGMQAAAIRATGIVSDMLAFSRRAAADFEPVRMNELLEAVLRLADSDYDLNKRYDFRQIEVIRDYDPDLGEVYCNRMEMEQVFMNVIKNAAEAMAGDGSRPARIALRTRREGDYVRVEIEDTGPGIDQNVRSRLFEPFFTTKPVGVGTGLGLSVSYFIVTERHHGSIAVSGAAGEGACFVIRLPLHGGGGS